ncbi:MAG: carboxypeptidase-like regulatory domain-containing protein [Bacteroides sp.]|nr:carboxypeptidase-like regulatory domain-containing protein [Bacteroides sp.]MCM1085296.1 carboxypeptidase-like regulatory domain-containing protein [Bacteroides sp.]
MKRYIKHSLMAMLAMCCCTACFKEEKPFLYELRVFVTYEDGTPVPDAEVSLSYNKPGQDDFPCTRLPEGLYVFPSLRMEGTYQVRAHKSGNEYKDDFRNVTLSEFKVETVELKLIRR